MAYLVSQQPASGTATTLTVNYVVDILPKDIIVVLYNTGANQGVIGTASDGANTFTSLFNNTPAVFSGAQYSIATTFRPANTALNLTIAIAAPIAGNMLVQVWRPDSGETFGTPTVVNSGTSTSVTTISTSITPKSPSLLISFDAMNTATASFTGDTDTLYGTWSNTYTAGSSPQIYSQYKLNAQSPVTAGQAATSQSYGPTWTSTTALQAVINVPLNLALSAYITSNGNAIINAKTQRTNLVINPSFEGNLSGWGSTGNPGTYSTAQAKFGTGSALLAYDGVNTVGLAWATRTDLKCIPGTQLTYSFYALRSADIGAITFNIIFYAADGATQISDINHSQILASQSTTGWYRASQTVTVPSGAVYAYPRIYVTVGEQGGATPFNTYIDGVLLEVDSTLNNYFDGSYAGAYWTGTPNLSTSVLQIGTSTQGTPISINSFSASAKSSGSISLTPLNYISNISLFGISGGASNIKLVEPLNLLIQAQSNSADKINFGPTLKQFINSNSVGQSSFISSININQIANIFSSGYFNPTGSIVDSFVINQLNGYGLSNGFISIQPVSILNNIQLIGLSNASEKINFGPSLKQFINSSSNTIGTPVLSINVIQIANTYSSGYFNPTTAIVDSFVINQLNGYAQSSGNITVQPTTKINPIQLIGLSNASEKINFGSTFKQFINIASNANESINFTINLKQLISVASNGYFDPTQSIVDSFTLNNQFASAKSGGSIALQPITSINAINLTGTSNAIDKISFTTNLIQSISTLTNARFNIGNIYKLSSIATSSANAYFTLNRVYSVAKNLLMNPTFDNGLYGWYGNAGLIYTSQDAPFGTIDGPNLLIIEDDGLGQASINQNLGIIPNTNYIFSAYVASFSGTNPKNVTLRITWGDGSTLEQVQSLDISNQWTRVVLSATSPANVNSATFSIITEAIGGTEVVNKTVIDAVMVEIGSSVSAFESIPSITNIPVVAMKILSLTGTSKSNGVSNIGLALPIQYPDPATQDITLRSTSYSNGKESIKFVSSLIQSGIGQSNQLEKVSLKSSIAQILQAVSNANFAPVRDSGLTLSLIATSTGLFTNIPSLSNIVSISSYGNSNAIEKIKFISGISQAIVSESNTSDKINFTTNIKQTINAISQAYFDSTLLSSGSYNINNLVLNTFGNGTSAFTMSRVINQIDLISNTNAFDKLGLGNSLSSPTGIIYSLSNSNSSEAIKFVSSIKQVGQATTNLDSLINHNISITPLRAYITGTGYLDSTLNPIDQFNISADAIAKSGAKDSIRFISAISSDAQIDSNVSEKIKFVTAVTSAIFAISNANLAIAQILNLGKLSGGASASINNDPTFNTQFNILDIDAFAKSNGREAIGLNESATVPDVNNLSQLQSITFSNGLEKIKFVTNIFQALDAFGSTNEKLTFVSAIKQSINATSTGYFDPTQSTVDSFVINNIQAFGKSGGAASVNIPSSVIELDLIAESNASDKINFKTNIAQVANADSNETESIKFTSSIKQSLSVTSTGFFDSTQAPISPAPLFIASAKSNGAANIAFTSAFVLIANTLSGGKDLNVPTKYQLLRANGQSVDAQAISNGLIKTTSVEVLKDNLAFTPLIVKSNASEIMDFGPNIISIINAKSLASLVIPTSHTLQLIADVLATGTIKLSGTALNIGILQSESASNGKITTQGAEANDLFVGWGIPI